MMIEGEWQQFEREVGATCPRLGFFAGATAMLKLVLRARSAGMQPAILHVWLAEIGSLREQEACGVADNTQLSNPKGVG